MERLVGVDTYLQHNSPFDDYFYLLPEDIQEQVNRRANERVFHSERELRRYVEHLARRA